MPISIRGLLARVKILRSDLGGDDAKAIFCITEAVRRVCRETRLSQTTIPVFALSASTLSTTPTVTGSDVVFAEKLKYANVPILGSVDPDNLGTFNPTTGAVTPAYGGNTVATGTAANFPASSFYIASVASTTDIDDITTSWDVGDVVYSDGSKWQQIKIRDFDDIEIANPNTLANNGYDQRENGVLKYATFELGSIKWFDPPKYDTAISATVSVVPTTLVSSDTLNIPVQAEDAIVQGAISLLFSLPGEEQDKRLALEHERRFHVCMGNLSAWIAIGQSGAIYWEPQDFLGSN